MSVHEKKIPRQLNIFLDQQESNCVQTHWAVSVQAVRQLLAIWIFSSVVVVVVVVMHFH